MWIKISNFAAVFLLSIFVGCGVTNVDPGNVGVEVNRCSGGGVSDKILPIGYQFTGPCTDIYEYPTSMQTIGWGGEEALHVNSSEGMTFDCSVSVNYAIEPSAAPKLYSKFRKGLGDIEQGYMKNLVKELLRQEFQRYTADKLVAEKQSDIRAAVEFGLRKELEKDGVNIKNFIISNAKAPQAVIDAITQRVKATQYGQQVENEIRATEADSKKKVALAKGEAEASITKAEAEAKVRKMKADAEEYYIKHVNESLTPAFVDYTRAQKWDGKLPTVTSGNTPFLDLRK